MATDTTKLGADFEIEDWLKGEGKPSDAWTTGGKQRRYVQTGLKDIEEGKLGWDAATRRQLVNQAKQAALQTTPTEELRKGALATGTGLAQGGATEAVAAASAEAAKAAAGVTPELATIEHDIAMTQKQNIEEMLMEQEGLFEGEMVKSGLESAGKAAGQALLTAAIASFCWVARVVVPEEWEDCRVYVLLGAPRWFRNLYLTHGEQFAGYIQDRPAWKWALRPLFRYFAWRGRLILKSWARCAPEA